MREGKNLCRDNLTLSAFPYRGRGREFTKMAAPAQKQRGARGLVAEFKEGQVGFVGDGFCPDEPGA